MITGTLKITSYLQDIPDTLDHNENKIISKSAIHSHVLTFHNVK